MASYSDDFDRANGEIGANWTEDNGDMDIVSNELIAQTAATNNRARYTAGTLDSVNHYVQFTVLGDSTSGTARQADSDLQLYSGGIISSNNDWTDAFRIRKHDSGETVLDTSGNPGFGSYQPHILKLTVDGATQVLDSISESVELCSAADSDITAGQYCGVLCWSDNTGWDDWSAADLAAGIEVTATLDSLTLTEYNPTILAPIPVTATLDTLVLTEYNATVNAEVSFDAGLDALVITEYNPDIKVDIDLTAGLDALVITEYAATVKVDISFTAGLDVLVITEYNATVAAGVAVTAGIDALILTEYNPVILAGLGVTAGFDPLILTEYNPAVAFDIIGLNRRGSSGLGFSFRDGWR